MDIQFLEDIGLTRSQAAAYKALVQSDGSSAPSIANEIGESRSNTYKILDKLCDLGLAIKDQGTKKTQYHPTSPAALEQLLQKQANEVHLRERKLQAELPSMLNFFFGHTEQPGVHHYQGKEGIKQIYSDMLATGKTLYLVRTPEDVRFYDEDFFAELRKKRLLLGIKTVGITPDVPSANHDPKVDEANKFIRHWIPAGAYTAGVEWNISGDKVALISYGQEAMGIVIHSPQIAESFRQIFQFAANSTTKR